MDSSQTRRQPPHKEGWIRAERLCEMKFFFLQGGTATVEYWMDRFNVSRQTVNNDLKVLGAKLHVPLICEEVWRMMDGAQVDI